MNILTEQCPTCNKECGMNANIGCADCNLCKYEHEDIYGENCKQCADAKMCNFKPKRSCR